LRELSLDLVITFSNVQAEIIASEDFLGEDENFFRMPPGPSSAPLESKRLGLRNVIEDFASVRMAQSNQEYTAQRFGCGLNFPSSFVFLTLDTSSGKSSPAGVVLWLWVMAGKMLASSGLEIIYPGGGLADSRLAAINCHPVGA
jgi:hypothetical protein